MCVDDREENAKGLVVELLKEQGNNRLSERTLRSCREQAGK